MCRSHRTPAASESESSDANSTAAATPGSAHLRQLRREHPYPEAESCARCTPPHIGNRVKDRKPLPADDPATSLLSAKFLLNSRHLRPHAMARVPAVTPAANHPQKLIPA